MHWHIHVYISMHNMDIHIYKCMYLDMHIGRYTRDCMCMHLSICDCIYVYMFACMQTYMYVHNCYTHLSLSLYIFKQFAYIYYCNYIMVM